MFGIENDNLCLIKRSSFRNDAEMYIKLYTLSGGKQPVHKVFPDIRQTRDQIKKVSETSSNGKLFFGALELQSDQKLCEKSKR
tara:strand:+ start:529 stop:777 length:249 start_codon:yes stop_codon:yes gene_type:complete